MFSTLRNRFGIPGVISVFALVFAMIGGAYAANDSGSNDGATASAKKAAKGPKGAKGAKGATGAAGPAGPAGPQGAKGDPGGNGASGADGDSVTGVAIGPGAPCPTGVSGVKYTLDGVSTNVCSGKNGTNGTNGDPWTPDGTLPEGATLTGTYAPPKPYVNTEFEITLPAMMEKESGYQLPIGFTIPLASAPELVFVPNVTENFGTATGCPGVNGGIPVADPGKLCVYAGPSSGSFPTATVSAFNPATVGGAPGVDAAGTILGVTCGAAPVACSASGLWAVTG